MENYIAISKLNDFLFCPLSLYYHSLYEKFAESVYHALPQTTGKIKHEAIDRRTYSTRKNILQGTEVYSEKFGLCGKIDIYDIEKKLLVERKNKITKIYDGYKFQIYGQYYCLLEMGYRPKFLALYSMSDNKKYPINLPGANDSRTLRKVINEIRNFNLENYMKNLQKNDTKCQNCIYNELCE